MDPIIEMLRDENNAIEQLTARREELKRKLEEHRSGNISAEEFEKLSAERKDIEKELALRTKRRDELTAAADKNKNQGEGRGIMNDNLLHFKDGMESADIPATAEYRSAFFKRLQRKPLEDLEKRAMTSASTSAGAAIPTQTMDMIIGQLRESDSLLGLITLTNVPSLTSFPVENVVNDASWVSEGSDSTSSSDSLKAVSLAAYTLIKTIKITAQVARMSIDAFETWLVNALVRKLRAACDKAIISGTGTNQPTGLDTLTWNATNSVTVAKAATVTYDNLVDLEALVGESFINNAVWACNRKMKATLLKLKDDQKRPLFERAVEDGFVGTLLGYPVRLDANVKDGEMYFGDWKSGYVMNFAQPIEIASSEEAGFMSGSVVYRGMALADGKPTGVAGALVKLVQGTV